MDSLLLFYYDVSCRIDYHCVSILILMDSLLLSRIKKLVNLDLENVSILILMDSLLLFKCYVIQLYELLCFNPYSNGFSSFINGNNSGMEQLPKCFNPYSNGFSSFIRNGGIENLFLKSFNPYSNGFSSFIFLGSEITSGSIRFQSLF